MLSPDQVASQGPGGFLNLNGGATDPYYAQADGTAYPSVAAACAAVPVPARRNRTVNVAGDEYWWKETDISDGGLVYKGGSATGTPGPIGPAGPQGEPGQDGADGQDGAPAGPPAPDFTPGPYPVGTLAYNPADGFTYRSKGLTSATAAPGSYTNWPQYWDLLGYDDAPLQSRISGVETGLSSFYQQLNQVKGRVDDHEYRISQLEGGTGTGSGYNDAELRGRIVELETDVDQLEQDVTRLDNEVDTIQALIPGSASPTNRLATLSDIPTQPTGEGLGPVDWFCSIQAGQTEYPLPPGTVAVFDVVTETNVDLRRLRGQFIILPAAQPRPLIRFAPGVLEVLDAGQRIYLTAWAPPAMNNAFTYTFPFTLA